MSVELLLIPVGLAAIAAIKAARTDDESSVVELQETRVTDLGLLVEALSTIGAQQIRQTETGVAATSPWGDLTFEEAGPVFAGRVDGDVQGSAEMLRHLDAAAGRIMQQRTAQRAIEQAEALGFRLIQQTEEDGTLNYVFEEL